MKLNIKKIIALTMFLITLPCLLFVSGCKNDTIKVYDIETKSIIETDIESYVEAVVAGEISNQAPMESLKAQAILARTFTINFIENNQSKYEGADISTDIQEAQAYNPNNINSRIKQAVKETKGVYLTSEGKPINAYFHSNSGGQTSLSREGFNNLDSDFKYLKSVKGVETTANSKNYSWKYTFSKTEILDALRNMGQSITSVSKVEKGEIGESGRCLTLIIGGKEISATTFRQNIGSTKLKSTLIDKITVLNDSVTFEGRGYGHGVGLSQEGAIVLANQGKNYKEIINYYFDNIKFKKR